MKRKRNKNVPGNFCIKLLTEDITIPISEAYVYSVPNQTYTGSKITPKPKITYAGETLVENVDYTLSYSQSSYAAVGTHTIKITGIDTYTGCAGKKYWLLFALFLFIILRIVFIWMIMPFDMQMRYYRSHCKA